MKTLFEWFSIVLIILTNAILNILNLRFDILLTVIILSLIRIGNQCIWSFIEHSYLYFYIVRCTIDINKQFSLHRNTLSISGFGKG